MTAEGRTGSVRLIKGCTVLTLVAFEKRVPEIAVLVLSFIHRITYCEMNPLEDNSVCGSNSLLKSYQWSKILLMIPLTFILLPWNLTAFLFTPRWKCDKHVYLTQLFLRPFKRLCLAGSGFRSGVLRPPLRLHSHPAPSITPGRRLHPGMTDQSGVMWLRGFASPCWCFLPLGVWECAVTWALPSVSTSQAESCQVTPHS